MGTLVLHNMRRMRRTLRTQLRTRRNAPRNSEGACQRDNTGIARRDPYDFAPPLDFLFVWRGIEKQTKQNKKKKRLNS